MGRWTSEYYDDVLNSKLKGLVSGAIKRSKLEKTEPTISYQNFVEDLDAGDSFTTTVIDILVKELAERRLRSSPNDRRLIADRTAKSLRLLATPLRIYHERRNPGRRTVNLTEYLTTPPEQMDMDEDDDEFDSMLDSTPVEGVQVNSELYDAYGPTRWATATVGRGSFASASPPTPALSDDSPIPPPMLSPPTSARTTVWSLPPAAPGSLSRQSSIRRPVRSRTVDFNDFTTRRRSSNRDLRADAGADETWTRTRRFFPFSHQGRRHDLWNEVGEGSGTELSDEPLTYITPDAFFPTPSSHAAETSEERVGVGSVPRLRRGGVRPPESLLLRHVSPTIVTAPELPAGEEAVELASGATQPLEPESEPASTGVDAEAAAYPTPPAVANENENEA
ncbi:hypothetical protein B0H10DRAFT_2038099 [Mycena sp. CBHHK59/15]|nr:hypothetical protein B0H10DRAFT_2038099 [Mycena sp. CBHHK59/15]